MGKYRKKPVEVEAHVFTGSSSSAGEIENWIQNGVFRESGIHTRDIRNMEIKTLEGTMIASPGDYIIKGLKGEFYPCKPDIFRDTYEAVEGTLRDPGQYEAKDLVSGDVVEYCGKNYAIVEVKTFADSTKLTLEDKTTIEVRPWTILMVTTTGE